jgi:hypothetical protein
MRAMGGAVDIGAVERPGRNPRHGFWAERVERGDRRQKHLRMRHAGTLMLDIGEHRLTDVLREGKAGGAPTLADHTERAVLPVDIAPPQRRHVSRAEP